MVGANTDGRLSGQHVVFDLFDRTRGRANHLPTPDRLERVIEKCGEQ